MTSFGEQWAAAEERAELRRMVVVPTIFAFGFGAFIKPIMRWMELDRLSFHGQTHAAWFMEYPWWVLSLGCGTLAFLFFAAITGSAIQKTEQNKQQELRIAKAIADEMKKSQ